MTWRKREKRCCKLLVVCIGFFLIFGIVFLGYYCPDRKHCALTGDSPTQAYISSVQDFIQGQVRHPPTSTKAVLLQDDLDRDYDLDIHGEDVLVFLHIQKTGGSTFGRHLVKHLSTAPCKCYRGRKRCDCHNSQRHIWLFSRFSVGWPCGLHADWTELHACVHEEMNRREKKERRRRYFRYLYITMLRDPIERYLSEWKHVQRGATWKAAWLKCNGRQATLDEVPFCFEGSSWKGVSLEEFLTCPHNLANNRQTRMLSNLSLVGCYNRSAMSPQQRDNIMLQSAKDNLRSMAFFGLTEFQHDTQLLFEKSFKLAFKEDFKQLNDTRARGIALSEKQRQLIRKYNNLDVELYKFAQDLFRRRLHKVQTEDSQRRTNDSYPFPHRDINSVDDSGNVQSHLGGDTRTNAADRQPQNYEEDFDYNI